VLKTIDFNGIRSITLKFFVLLAPAVTLTTILFCVIVGFLNYRELSLELENKLDLIIKTNGGAVAEPLWNINSEGTKSSVRTIVIHPEIICASVTDTQWSDTVAWPEGCEQHANTENMVSSGLTIRGQSVGKLNLYYTKQPIFERLRRDVLVSALLFFLLILVTATVAYSALKLIVKTPLDYLMESIRSAESGDNRPVTQWSANDEMGSVVAAYNKMINQVERYTDELVISRERAEKAGASKTRFLANMSHELRTPLNAVIGITEMMRDQAIRKEENIEPYERVTRAGRHLLGLIDNILDFSKIDADRIDLIIEEIPTQPFIHDLENTAVELVRRNNNEFSLLCGELPGTLRVDVLRLTQILINLIGNACKFTENGTVTLKIERMEQSAGDSEIDGRNPPNYLKFSIIDTGIGMSKSQTEQLFGDFSQIDVAVTRKYGGTGLGLAISQRLCRMMESEISVSSQLNEGSEFSFVLGV